MIDGTPATTAAPDLAEAESAFWAQLESESQGNGEETVADTEPATDTEVDAPEEQVDTGVEKLAGESTEAPASEEGLEDEIPLDGELDNEAGDAGDSTPDSEGDDSVDEDSREPNEDEVTVQNAQERIRSAQSLMHDATTEAAQLRKELEAERARAESLSEKMQETQKAIDTGTAKSRREQRREQIVENLNEEQRENFDLYGDMVELMLDVMEAQGNSGKDATSEKAKTDADGESSADELSPKAQAEHESKIKSWQEGVINGAPEWFDLVNTDEWKQFAGSNPGFMQAVQSRYDNLDPQGALAMYRGFQRWTSTQDKSKSKKAPTKTASPRSRTVASPNGKAAPVRSRESVEADAWSELGG